MWRRFFPSSGRLQPTNARQTRRPRLRPTCFATALDLILFYSCLIAEFDGQPAGFALYFFNYSTWLGAQVSISRISSSSRSFAAWESQGAAQAGCSHRHREELPAPSVGGARLEHSRHRLLSRHGSGVSGRVAQCTSERRGAGAARRLPATGLRRRVYSGCPSHSPSFRRMGGRLRISIEGRKSGGGALRIRVIGGGLAGRRLPDRRAAGLPGGPLRDAGHGGRKAAPDPAHQTIEFGELVCSNSLKSDQRTPRLAPQAGDAPRRFGSSAHCGTRPLFQQATRWPWIASSSPAALPRRLPPSP